MKRSIKSKLFIVIFSILILNIIIVLLFGETLLADYYIWSTKNNLKNYENKIESEINKDSNNLSSILNECAVNNITVLIYDSQVQTMLYSTVRNQNTPNGQNTVQTQTGIDAQRWLKQAMNDNIFYRLETQNPIIEAANNDISNSIYLYSKLKAHTYLFMETPQEYIEATAQVAVRFFAIISIMTLIIAGIVVYFIARHIAQPIKKIDRTAQRIAKMDFSEKCEIHTGDEIEALAGSVNKMALQLEQNINLLRYDLEREEQTNKMRKEFIANVSHDLKTPLSLISSYTEAFCDGTVSQEETVLVLQEQCHRIDRMVNQMLMLSRLESGMMQYDMIVFAIDEVISSVLKTFHLPMQKLDIQFSCDMEPNCIVQGDYNKIIQVFTNFIENAIKYVDQKKKIHVTVGKGEQFVQVSIYNSHQPLSEEQLSNVFEMFYRTDQSREVGEKSYGIGLAIVKNIITAHGGKYGVCNLDDGVCFWFTLKSIEVDDDWVD